MTLSPLRSHRAKTASPRASVERPVPMCERGPARRSQPSPRSHRLSLTWSWLRALPRATQQLPRRAPLRLLRRPAIWVKIQRWAYDSRGGSAGPHRVGMIWSGSAGRDDLAPRPGRRPVGLAVRSQALISSPVASVLASVLAAVDAVGDDGGGAYDCRGAGDGGADDASPGGAYGSEWHVSLLFRRPRGRPGWPGSGCARWR